MPKTLNAPQESFLLAWTAMLGLAVLIAVMSTQIDFFVMKNSWRIVSATMGKNHATTNTAESLCRQGLSIQRPAHLA